MPFSCHFNLPSRFLLWAIITLLSPNSIVISAELPPHVTPIESLPPSSAPLFRDDSSVYVCLLSPGGEGSIEVPRFFASLRAAAWLTDHTGEHHIQVVSQPNSWTLKWKDRPPESHIIKLTFETRPLLTHDLKAISPAADGSLRLPAFRAITVGKLLRFEPQPAKNTVGYWVDASDYAYWPVEFPHAGSFHVGVLQGCGKGQGESTVRVALIQNDAQVHATEFSVLETGHFQSFVWRNVGTMKVSVPGRYEIRLEAVNLKKNAVMDVREIHLTPIR